MQIDKILEFLYGDKVDYKGTKIMKELLNNNEDFKLIIIEGIKNGKICGFPEDLWVKIENQNIIGINSFLDVFKEGLNLGTCTPSARQLSFSFPNGCLIAGGGVDYLKGTKNCPNGNHTWVVWEGKIYDTTFMAVIDLKFAEKLKYKQENIYNPSKDNNYSAAKDYANDPFVDADKKRR